MVVIQIERANEPLPDDQQEWEAIEHHYYGDSNSSEAVAVNTATEINHWFTFKGYDHKFRARVIKWLEHPDGTFSSEVLI